MTRVKPFVAGFAVWSGLVAVSFFVSTLACAPLAYSQQVAGNAVQESQQLIAEKKFAEAEQKLAAFVRDNANAALAWFLLGFARQSQEKFDLAIEAYEKASTFQRMKPNAHYNMACIFAVRKDTEKAIEQLKLAVTAGFGDRELLATDSDLDNIRKDPRFSGLLPRVLEDQELFLEPTNIVYTLHGEDNGDEFGWVARKLGDLDRDGVQDFVATSPGSQFFAGKVYVYSGKSGKRLFSHVGPQGQRLGNGASAAGDVNGDGSPDVITCGPFGKSGLAVVLSGKDGKVIHSIEGPSPGKQFGYKSTGIGDIDGDRHADFVITELLGDGDRAGSGRCHIYSGKAGKLLFTINGEEEGDKFGSAVCGVTNKLGTWLLVGAQDAGAGDGGCVYGYRITGGKENRLFKFEVPNSVDLGQMFLSNPGDYNKDGIPDFFCSDFGSNAGVQGGGRWFVISGKDGKPILDVKGKVANENLGTSISDAGDVNGDGFGDLVVGAWQNSNGAQSGGCVYLFSGRDGAELRKWTCKQVGDTFGFDATGIGDVNGDGKIDFLITSAWSSVRKSKGGRVFVISGK